MAQTHVDVFMLQMHPLILPASLGIVHKGAQAGVHAAPGTTLEPQAAGAAGSGGGW
ncbi:MAG: hypothetical protein M3O46_11170 [Myxococcota bacterium]|nr:hypothetical protein [Myxococcota bacterium]